LTVGGVARSLQIHADMRLASALPTVKIPASSCKGYFLTDPYPCWPMKLDGIAAVAGEGCGFWPELNHHSGGQGGQGSGDGIARKFAGGITGAFGKVAAGT
jgi:hypothetical protein